MIGYDSLRQALIDRRKELGLTQRQAATTLGMAQSQLSELESGKTPNPSIDTLNRWASGLTASIRIDVHFDEITVRHPARQATFTLEKLP